MSSKTEDKYIWTNHAQIKMRYYGLSQSRIKRIIRFPERVEEGIAPDTVAVMRPAGTKEYSEVWVMYVTIKNNGGKIKIITAWRYPGKSPERDPVPEGVLKEVRGIIGW